MAFTFNDTSTENGFCQEIDSICGTDPTSYSLKKKARRMNNALDQYFSLSMKYCGNWSVGDTNASDLSSATNDVVSGTQKYLLNTSMLVIDSLWIMGTDGVYQLLTPTTGESINSTISGTPTKYQKMERTIILDKVPNFSTTAGLKIFFRRTWPRFVYTDTTKTAGTPGIHDMYLSRVASLPYLVEKQLPNKNDIQALIQKDELLIQSYFSLRERDVKRRMQTDYSNNNSSK